MFKQDWIYSDFIKIEAISNEMKPKGGGGRVGKIIQHFSIFFLKIFLLKFKFHDLTLQIYA